MNCPVCHQPIPLGLAGPEIIYCPNCKITGIPEFSSATIQGESAVAGQWMGINRDEYQKEKQHG